MDTHRALAPGVPVGAFVIDRFLAQGGTGSVYRARQARPGAGAGRNTFDNRPNVITLLD